MLIEYRFEVLYPYSVHANILNMKSYLTYRLKSKKITPEAYAVVDAYLLSAKNVRNSVVFLINNILTAYTYNKENKQFLLKEELHQNQKDMIAFRYTDDLNTPENALTYPIIFKDNKYYSVGISGKIFEIKDITRIKSFDKYDSFL